MPGIFIPTRYQADFAGRAENPLAIARSSAQCALTLIELLLQDRWLAGVPREAFPLVSGAATQNEMLFRIVDQSPEQVGNDAQRRPFQRTGIPVIVLLFLFTRL